MVSIWTVHSLSLPPLQKLPTITSFGTRFGNSNWNARKSGNCRNFALKAAVDNDASPPPPPAAAAADDDDGDVNVDVKVQTVEESSTSDDVVDHDDDECADDDVVVNTVVSENPVDKFRQMIGSVSPPPFTLPLLVMKQHNRSNFFIGLCIATAVSVISIVLYKRKKSKDSHPGSVADLVRRGQLRSDRRGISRPLKYEDPFNNPMVKVGKGKSTVEMCGKVYRLAPVNLTEEQRTVHQKRRSRAYQWKRPTVFLKEGDAVPPDVDPDTIRWIPANHPFATTASDIDEDLAQNNVYQKHGVPFRIQAEHDALQKKLEALQNDDKLNNLVIDPKYAKDFERPFKSPSKSQESANESLSDNQVDKSSSAKQDDIAVFSDSNSPSEEVKKQPPVI